MPQRLRFIEKNLPQTKNRGFEVQKPSGVILGAIHYYSDWRRFVFVPLPLTIYTVEELEEIIIKLDEVQEQYGGYEETL